MEPPIRDPLYKGQLLRHHANTLVYYFTSEIYRDNLSTRDKPLVSLVRRFHCNTKMSIFIYSLIGGLATVEMFSLQVNHFSFSRVIYTGAHKGNQLPKPGAEGFLPIYGTAGNTLIAHIPLAPGKLEPNTGKNTCTLNYQMLRRKLRRSWALLRAAHMLLVITIQIRG